MGEGRGGEDMTPHATHTPGPWDCDNAWAVGKRAPNGSLDLIANLSYSCFQNAKEADARLIAAAPAMYEALGELVAYLRNHVADEVLDNWAPVLKAAYALAQADGKQ